MGGAHDDKVTAQRTIRWTGKGKSNCDVYETEQGKKEDELCMNKIDQLRRVVWRGREETRKTMMLIEEYKDVD